MRRWRVVAVAVLLAASAPAIPLLGGLQGLVEEESGSVRGTVDVAGDPAGSESTDGSGVVTSDYVGLIGGGDVVASASADDAAVGRLATEGSVSAGEGVSTGDVTAETEGPGPGAGSVDGSALASVAQEDDDRAEAVEAGVEDGVELARAQGVEVTQDQRARALEGAGAAVAQHQGASVEQVQSAVAGAVHGAAIQGQRVNATQVQAAVAGATDGALAQHQEANATQLQSAAWGATHGALAQEARVTVEQLQVATYGAASGAAGEAGERNVDHVPAIQEAAQGAAYGVLEQYQRVTVEQRQRITVEHVRQAASGAAAGVLEGTLEAEQRVTVEQRQTIDAKQVQEAAKGGAAGAIDHRQEATVEATGAAARGASAGAVTQAQSVAVEQRQRVSSGQIGAATDGAAKGAIRGSQEATVEQVQAAADGAARGVLVQRQRVSITQVQSAAIGAATGAVETAVQEQVVEVEQIQAAAWGAGQGAVVQTQVVDVTQVQYLARGGSSGALGQSQTASVEQVQVAARSASQETARVVQGQRVSVTQLQSVTAETAADAAAYAASEGVDDPTELTQVVSVEATQNLEAVDEPEGTASIAFADQESDGESVVVDEVALSEGGFVAIYDDVAVDADPGSIVGVSAYLEPGEHTDVEVDLDDPLAGDGPLVAAVHLDTTDDETFRYVETDGTEDVPYVTAGGVPVLDVAFVTVEGEPAEPEATLAVSDQMGDGASVVVDEAAASVPFALTVADTDGEEIGRSVDFQADETVENESIGLDPALEDDTTLGVALVSTAADGDDSLADPAEDDPIGEDGAVGEDDLVEGDEPIGVDEPAADDGTDGDEVVLERETIEYTVEEAEPAFDVAFPACTRAEVTGTFADGDTVIVATGFYESGGFGNTMGEYAITVGDDVAAPLEGTIVFETGEEFSITETDDGATVDVPEGDFGTAITGIASPDAIPGSIDYPNPDASECIAEVRPEPPEIVVLEAAPVEDGDVDEAVIEVTFGYDNPNDATLAVGSAFVEGTTDDEPPEELEPGEGTFAVEWTPEGEDERLVWEVDLSNYDSDEVRTAATPPAEDIVEIDPAEFAVSIVDTNAPVERGESLEVTADLENVGGEAATRTVTLAVDGDERDALDVPLEPGETETIALSAGTDDLAAGEYAIAVETEDDRDETTVTIEDGEAAYTIVDVSGPPTSVAGQDVTVVATITNAGDAADEGTVTYRVDGDAVAEETIALEPGGFTTVSFTSTLSAGESTHTVETDDDEASLTIDGIEIPGVGGAAGDGTPAPDDAGDAEGEDGEADSADGTEAGDEPEPADETQPGDEPGADDPFDDGPFDG